MACFVARPRSCAARTRAERTAVGCRAGSGPRGPPTMPSVWHRVAGLQHVGVRRSWCSGSNGRRASRNCRRRTTGRTDTAAAPPPANRALTSGYCGGDGASFGSLLWYAGSVDRVARTVGDGVAPERRALRLPVAAVQNAQLEVRGRAAERRAPRRCANEAPRGRTGVAGSGEQVPVVAVAQLKAGAGARESSSRGAGRRRCRTAWPCPTSPPPGTEAPRTPIGNGAIEVPLKPLQVSES